MALARLKCNRVARPHRTWDSIGDLARAAAGLVIGLPEQIVSWHFEPGGYQFRFVEIGARTRLEVNRFPSGASTALVAVTEVETEALARALWRGLRRLQGSMPPEEYAVAGRHPFPADTVQRLGENLRARAG